MDQQISFTYIMKRAFALACSPSQWGRAIKEMNKPLKIELIILLIMQVLSWILVFNQGSLSFMPDWSKIGLISLFAGVTSIIGVVLDSSGNITNFFFSALNNVAYIYVSFAAHLYGEVYLNIYFLVLEFLGAYVWTKKNLVGNTKDNEVQVKELTAKGWLVVTVIVLVGWLLLGIFLKHVPFITTTLDPHPWIDAISVVVQVVAQLLMVLRYGISQFIMWIIANVAEIILWTLSFNPIFIVLFFACLVNSFFGLVVWNQKRKAQEAQALTTQNII